MRSEGEMAEGRKNFIPLSSSAWNCLLFPAQSSCFSMLRQKFSGCSFLSSLHIQICMLSGKALPVEFLPVRQLRNGTEQKSLQAKSWHSSCSGPKCATCQLQTVARADEKASVVSVIIRWTDHRIAHAVRMAGLLPWSGQDGKHWQPFPPGCFLCRSSDATTLPYYMGYLLCPQILSLNIK